MALCFHGNKHHRSIMDNVNIPLVKSNSNTYVKNDSQLVDNSLYNVTSNYYIGNEEKNISSSLTTSINTCKLRKKR